MAAAEAEVVICYGFNYGPLFSVAWRNHLPNRLVEYSETKRLEIEESGNRVIARFFDLATNFAEVERR